MNASGELTPKKLEPALIELKNKIKSLDDKDPLKEVTTSWHSELKNLKREKLDVAQQQRVIEAVNKVTNYLEIRKQVSSNPLELEDISKTVSSLFLSSTSQSFSQALHEDFVRKNLQRRLELLKKEITSLSDDAFTISLQSWCNNLEANISNSTSLKSMQNITEKVNVVIVYLVLRRPGTNNFLTDHTNEHYAALQQKLNGDEASKDFSLALEVDFAKKRLELELAALNEKIKSLDKTDLLMTPALTWAIEVKSTLHQLDLEKILKTTEAIKSMTKYLTERTPDQSRYLQKELKDMQTTIPSLSRNYNYGLLLNTLENDFPMRCKTELEKILKLYRDIRFETQSGGTKLFLEINNNKVPAILDKKAWEKDQKNAVDFYNRELPANKQEDYEYQCKELKLPRSGAEIYKSITNLLQQSNISKEDYTKMLIEIYNKLSPKTERTKGLSTLFGMRARNANTARFNNNRILEIKPLLKEALNIQLEVSDINFDNNLKEAIEKRKPSFFQRMSRSFR